VAIIPSIAQGLNMTREFAQFFGGTSLLIMVGVVLDTLQQIDSYRAMRQYESLMKSGNFSAREEGVVIA
jgi:preprotein translocase subunit SecY